MDAAREPSMRDVEHAVALKLQERFMEETMQLAVKKVGENKHAVFEDASSHVSSFRRCSDRDYLFAWLAVFYTVYCGAVQVNV